MVTQEFTPQPQVFRDGFCAELHTAKSKTHNCRVCKGVIKTGDKYYAMIACGGGIQPYPPRVHLACFNDFFKDK